MRIAIIRRRIHSQGGVEGYALRLIHGLKERGIDVSAIAEEYEPEDGIKFFSVRPRSFSFTPSPVLFSRSCQDIVTKEKFDIVHSLERTWPQDIYRAGEGCHAEFIKTLSLKERLNPKHLLNLYIEKKAFLCSDYIMANSERVKREIIAHYGIPENRIVVIYTGVDLDRFNPQKLAILRKESRETLNLGKEELAILFAGSGFRRKGLGLLIKALHKARFSSFKLLVAGGGNPEPYIRLAASLGLKENIKFLGLVNDIDYLYAGADIFVLPSLYEPFSNTALEAMASGLPVLTTRVNGVSEILQDNHFIIENPFDRDEMTHKIALLSSKDARDKFSLKVAEIARRFSFSWHLDSVLKLYDRVLANKKR